MTPFEVEYYPGVDASVNTSVLLPNTMPKNFGFHRYHVPIICAFTHSGNCHFATSSEAPRQQWRHRIWGARCLQGEHPPQATGDDLTHTTLGPMQGSQQSHPSTPAAHKAHLATTPSAHVPVCAFSRLEAASWASPCKSPWRRTRRGPAKSAALWPRSPSWSRCLGHATAKPGASAATLMALHQGDCGAHYVPPRSSAVFEAARFRVHSKPPALSSHGPESAAAARVHEAPGLTSLTSSAKRSKAWGPAPGSWPEENLSPGVGDP